MSVLHGRDKRWQIVFPYAKRLKENEDRLWDPWCKCCNQVRPQLPLKPEFLFSHGENTGFDKCAPEEAISRVGKETEAGIYKEPWGMVHLDPVFAWHLLWIFGHHNTGYDDPLGAAKTIAARSASLALMYPNKQELDIVTFYGEWSLRETKRKLRAQKASGDLAESYRVR